MSLDPSTIYTVAPKSCLSIVLKSSEPTTKMIIPFLGDSNKAKIRFQGVQISKFSGGKALLTFSEGYSIPTLLVVQAPGSSTPPRPNFSYVILLLEIFVLKNFKMQNHRSRWLVVHRAYCRVQRRHARLHNRCPGTDCITLSIKCSHILLHIGRYHCRLYSLMILRCWIR